MADDHNDYSDDPMEWRRVRRAVIRVEQSWPIVGPIVALVTNWKAWAVGAAFFLWLRGEDIITAIVRAAQ